MIIRKSLPKINNTCLFKQVKYIIPLFLLPGDWKVILGFEKNHFGLLVGCFIKNFGNESMLIGHVNAVCHGYDDNTQLQTSLQNECLCCTRYSSYAPFLTWWRCFSKPSLPNI